jgi:hypothetical protein
LRRHIWEQLRFTGGTYIPYSFYKGDKFLIGYIEGHPEYPAQGKTIQDLEKHLLEIHH